MSYEEAIERLRWKVENCDGCGRRKDDIESFEMAINALEKQIPKPKHKYNGYRCVCGEQVAKNQDYCEYCGQRLEVGE